MSEREHWCRFCGEPGADGQTCCEDAVDVADLRARLEKAERERDEFKRLGQQFEHDSRSHFDQSCLNLQRAEAAEAKLARAREALRAINGCILWSDTTQEWSLLSRWRTQPALALLRAALSDDAPAPTEPLGCNCLHECPSEEERSGGAECVHDADCVLSAQPDPTPRYDEVFHDGTAWLDKQAELDEWPDPAPSAEPSCDCHFRDGELTWPCLWHKRDLERRVAQAREEALEEAAVMADRIDDMLPMSSGIPDAIRALKGGGR